MTGRPPARVQKAKRSLVKRLSGRPGFIGAGVSVRSAGDYELVVLVVEKANRILADVPEEWEGIPVRTKVGGAPRKF